MLSHSYDPEPNDRKLGSDHDMDMDTGEQPTKLGPPLSSDVGCRYHQNGATTWTLPFDPFGANAESSGSQPRGHGYYRKRCRMIRNSWKSDNPQDWLPSGMVERTAYSLTLLCALAFLATLTKGRRQDTLDALLKARNLRLTTSQADTWVTTRSDSPHCETIIIENTSGILLADVKSVTSLATATQGASRDEKLVKRAEAQQAIAAKRVVERRHKRRQNEINLQRELWKEQSGGDIELVGLEYSNGDVIEPTMHDKSDASNETMWQTLRRQAKHSHELGRAMAAQRVETTQTGLPKKLSKSTARLTKLRARTMSEMKDELNEEDLSWDDSEDERDAHDNDSSKVDMANHSSSSKKEKRLVNRLANALESNPTLDPDIKSNKRGRKRTSRHHEQKALRRARDAEEVLARAKAKSIRLPSEMMDFSAIGKLQPAAHNDEMTSMTGALNGIL